MIKTPSTLSSQQTEPVNGDAPQRQNGTTYETEQSMTTELTRHRAEQRTALDSFAGSFADDPFWDEMMAAIEEDRRKMDAKYDLPE